MKLNLTLKQTLILSISAYLFGFLVAFILNYKKGNNQKQDSPKDRINGVETKLYSGQEFIIIQVDSVEYLCSATGGIFPILKKQPNN